MARNDIERISFMFYHNWKKQMEILSDAQVRQLVYNLIYYHEGEDEKIKLETDLEKAVWLGILPGIEINHKKYQNRVEANRKNGKRGGRPKDESKEPKEPSGFSENPENLIIDNRKEIIENREKINDNSKKEIVKSEKVIDIGEKTIDNSKQKIRNGELTKEEIEEFIGDSNKLKEYLDKRVGSLRLVNNSVQEKFNPENIGEDIVDDNQISSFSSNIDECWNSNTKLSNKIEEMNNIGYRINSIFFNTLTGKILELMNKNEYDKIPQFNLTKNNLKLFQLFSNIQFFLKDVKKIEEKMAHSSF